MTRVKLEDGVGQKAMILSGKTMLTVCISTRWCRTWLLLESVESTMVAPFRSTMTIWSAMEQQHFVSFMAIAGVCRIQYSGSNPIHHDSMGCHRTVRLPSCCLGAGSESALVAFHDDIYRAFMPKFTVSDIISTASTSVHISLACHGKDGLNGSPPV